MERKRADWSEDIIVKLYIWAIHKIDRANYFVWLSQILRSSLTQ